ncbi:hypothetical protein [Salmonirosea aquatica]|uniref:Uncharacterized protein n=1 Tax=Salmonirosea aquatica TaxID=2654236 RepID=A0A7C9B806_9BACT|nr:hypothetical protein [Cytophagaceae bacterium SJW1-29]
MKTNLNPQAMKLKSIFLVIAFSVFSFSFIADEIKVTPDFTDKQIKEAEQEAAKWFKDKIEIKVIKRDPNGKIVHLIFTIFNATGRPHTVCESDNFGFLIIYRSGGRCGIADKS